MTQSLGCCWSKICIARARKNELSRISRELCLWREGILSTSHKVSFPNFPSSSGLAWWHSLKMLFLVTNRVWKLDMATQWPMFENGENSNKYHVCWHQYIIYQFNLRIYLKQIPQFTNLRFNSAPKFPVYGNASWHFPILRNCCWLGDPS